MTENMKALAREMATLLAKYNAKIWATGDDVVRLTIGVEELELSGETDAERIRSEPGIIEN